MVFDKITLRTWRSFQVLELRFASTRLIADLNFYFSLLVEEVLLS